MICAVVVPVGPGHQALAQRALGSAMDAWQNRSPAWTDYGLVESLDLAGEYGRSAARNFGIRAAHDADWYFLLDADDTMGPKAFRSFDPREATGAVYGWPSFAHADGRNRRVKDGPRTWDGVVSAGPVDTLTMGAFFHGPSLRAHLFREDLDHGEDWEFHLSFGAKYGLTRVKHTLCWVGYDQPSAGGPRGGECDWAAVSEPFFRFWRKRGRVPLTDEERKTDYWK